MSLIVKLLELFYIFFKISLFTFGGGYSTIQLIKDELNSNNINITDTAFYEFVGISQSTPGPFAINIATFTGYEQAGFLGAVFSTLGVVIPPLVIILLVQTALKKVLNSKSFNMTLLSIKPVIVAFIFVAGLNIFNHVILKNSLNIYKFDYIQFLIFLIVFLIAAIKKFQAMSLILIAGILGVIFYGI